jgi:hypothetical protein
MKKTWLKISCQTLFKHFSMKYSMSPSQLKIRFRLLTAILPIPFMCSEQQSFTKKSYWRSADALISILLIHALPLTDFFYNALIFCMKCRFLVLVPVSSRGRK